MVSRPWPSMKIGREQVPALNITQTYKYLGLVVSSHQVTVQVEEKLKFQLEQTMALKPAQRLYILRANNIPATYHQLVLANMQKGSQSDHSDILTDWYIRV